MTLYTKIPTTDPVLSVADIAKWCLACFPAGVLMAVTFFPVEVLPWFVKFMEVWK